MDERTLPLLCDPETHDALELQEGMLLNPKSGRRDPRLEQLLNQHADQPLSRIWELVMGEVKQHGVQQDDQSLLLLRVCE